MVASLDLVSTKSHWRRVLSRFASTVAVTELEAFSRVVACLLAFLTFLCWTLIGLRCLFADHLTLVGLVKAPQSAAACLPRLYASGVVNY